MKLYRCQKNSADAFGFPSPGGFTVIKGSIISDHVAPSFDLGSKFYFRIRNELIASGVILDRQFQQDYEFASSTAAGAVVVGSTISGRAAWNLNSSEEENHDRM